MKYPQIQTHPVTGLPVIYCPSSPEPAEELTPERLHDLLLAQEVLSLTGVPVELTEDGFWRLAEEKPLAAMDHPLFDLLTLADPAHWLTLELCNAARWVETLAPALDDIRFGLFAADCVESVIHLISDRKHGETTPQLAIDKIRAYLRGEITPQELHAVWIDCVGIRGKYRIVSSAHEAEQMRWASFALHDLAMTESRIHRVPSQVISQCIWASTGKRNLREERKLWVSHWRRLLPYLRQLPAIEITPI